MDITNKAVKISRAICSIEESLANGDLLAREADDLRIELEELREWDDLLNAYFTARSNGEKLQAERDALAAQLAALNKLHSDLTNADMVLDDGEHSGYLITSEQLEDMEHYLSEPILCLAAHDAEVAKKAVLDYNLQLRKDIDDKLPMRCIGVHGDDYAAQLRAKAQQ